MRESDSKKPILGVVLAVIGLILLLRNMGVTSIDMGDIISDYWPLVIVALGLYWVLSPNAPEQTEHVSVEGQDASAASEDLGGLSAPEFEEGTECGEAPGSVSEAAFDSSSLQEEEPGADVGGDSEDETEIIRHRSIVGWVIAILGLLILGSNTRRWTASAGQAGGVFWAAVAILMGLAMAKSSDRADPGGKTNWAVLSRVDHAQPGWELRSGSYLAILGNVVLDLSVAHIPDGEIYLDITSVLGGVRVILPNELPVKCEGTAVLGSVNAFGHSAGGGVVSRDFVRHGSGISESSLHIRCRTILGYVDIR